MLFVALLTGACSTVGNQLATTPKAAKLDGIAVSSPPTTAPTAGDTAIAPPPERFEGAPAPRRRPPARLTQAASPASGTWAVIIGINDYPGSLYDLRSAVADADDIDAALGGMGVPADHRMVLRDGQVTRQVLRSAAEWLTKVAGPDAKVVFAFAGHVRKSGPGTESMVTADGATVTDAELAAIFKRLQAQQAWVVMAACYGGGFTEVLRPGVVLTGAAPADKEAFENPAFDNSYLVEFMVNQAMTGGRAADTVQSAFEFARQAIAREYPDRDRVPVQFDQSGGPLDLRPPGVTRPAAAGRTPAPPPTTTTSTPPQQQPADKGNGNNPPPSDGDTASGGGTLSPPPRPSDDTCKTLTVGVVNCTSSR